MLNFTMFNPTKLLFGEGTISSIGHHLKEANLHHVLLVYGRDSIKKNGVYDMVTTSLSESGIAFTELNGVKPNPVLSKVQEGIDLVKTHQIDAILAVGGGSVLDSSKAIAVGSLYDGNVWDFFEGKPVTCALPIYAVLTLSATGSEMNKNAVITNEAEGKKWSIGSIYTHPTLSILDPSVQKSLPKVQTVNGAIDAISHVFEAYYGGTKQTDMLDHFSEGIIKTILEHTPILLNAPENYASRSELALAATLALNGLNGMGRAGDWASHGIEHSLSVFNDIAHGSGLAIIMPAWMKYVYKHDLAKFAKGATNLFGITEGTDEEKALAGIEALISFYRSLGAPTTLKEVGVTRDNLDEIADNAALSAPLGSLVKLEREDIYKILEIALGDSYQ